MKVTEKISETCPYCEGIILDGSCMDCGKRFNSQNQVVEEQ